MTPDLPNLFFFGPLQETNLPISFFMPNLSSHAYILSSILLKEHTDLVSCLGRSNSNNGLLEEPAVIQMLHTNTHSSENFKWSLMTV